MKQEIFYNKTINKKELKSIVHSAFQSYGIVKATNLAECLKKQNKQLELNLIAQNLDLAMGRADVPIKASCFCRLKHG